MVKIPEGDFLFKMNGIEIEGINDIGVDVQYPWEDSPRRFHEHPMHIKSFYIDKFPVTNAEFKKFLDATHYHPQDDLNFLRDWKDGNYPAGWEQSPGHLGLHRRRARLCGLGGEAAAARMGMAVCRARHGWAAVSLGQRVGCFGRSGAGQVAHHARTGSRGCPSEGSEPVWGDGSGGKCVAMDGRIHGRPHARRNPARRQLLPAAGINLVFSASVQIARARQTVDDVARAWIAPGALGFRLVQDAQSE